MCGLFGIINLDRRPLDLAECECTLAILDHRGPDGSGHYHRDHVFLGHTRLSIIDVAGGAQPIYSEDGRFLVIFNGEIYNHEELRAGLVARGHHFKTRSDTEVLVHLFEEERERLLGKLIGMFAFAIFDTKTGSLFLARDRIGIKPLYYYCDGRQFIFSSEMKAIIKSGRVPVEVDDRVVYQFLTLHHSVPPDTLVKGIVSLQAGHYLFMNGGPGPQVPYWDIESNADAELLSEKDALLRVEDLLSDAVEKRLMSEVPLGLFLSGGVDSSLVAVLMHRIVGSGIKTFSIGFEEKEWSEVPYSRRVSRMIDSDHTEIIVTPKDMMDLIEPVVWYRETPISEMSDIPIHLLCRAASEKVTVVLTGEGGDEVFGGYRKYQFENVARRLGAFANPFVKGLYRSRMGGTLIPHRVSTALDLFLVKDRFDRYYRWFSYFREEELAGIMREDRRHLMGGENPYARLMAGKQFRSNIEEMQYLDIKVWLPDDLLLRADRLSMASGLEARVPFLDHRLVELGFLLPTRLKVRESTGKYIVKRIAEKYLDRDLLYRKKVGFAVPVGEWFRGGLKDFLIGHLTRSNSFAAEYMRRDAIERLVSEHIAGTKDHHNKLWMLLNLELWRDAFVSRS
jgi:asparagine synthase (glutamine-hydrolysing)